MTFNKESIKRSVFIRIAIWLFLSFSIFYIGITRGHFVGTDEIAVFQTSRSLWEKGELSTGYIVNTFIGRNGLYYSQYNAGQSIAALPLYGSGKTLGIILKKIDKEEWIAIFAGPSIGQEPSRWGGDIEIFFVNLFNCFTTALLCAVFFAFSIRLGVSPQWSLISTALLGLTTFVGPFSTGFLQHSSEALLLLWAFYFLFLNTQHPNWRSCLWAGVIVALMILFRFPSVISIPSLTLYLLLSLRQHRLSSPAVDSFLLRPFQQLISFSIPVTIGFALNFIVNYIKFETIWGKYKNEGFYTPLLKGLFAFLLSPGDSIFLFTPLLLLSPWLYRRFWQQYRLEIIIIFSLAITYIVFYGKYTAWHGLWSSLGPRYLIPIVPILLLPLGKWMEHAGKKVWFVVAPLATIGFWIQLVHVAVNFAFVYHFEKYPEYQPPYSFLFIPDVAPVVAFSKAFLSADFRVDMWLINVYRGFGFSYVIALVTPLLVLLIYCLWKLWNCLRQEQSHLINDSSCQTK
jgi:hypothetical protein